MASNIGDNKFPQNPPTKTQNLQIGAQVCLRILTIATALSATCLVLNDKKTVDIFGIKMGAKYIYSPALRVYAYANFVAFAFFAMSFMILFVICCLNRSKKPKSNFFLFLHDLVMMALVLAGCTATTAIGYVGQFGNDHISWLPICDHFGKFYHKLACSIVLSYFSVLFLLALTIMSSIRSN